MRERCFPDKLLGKIDIEPLFATEKHTVITDENKSKRVWISLHKKLSKYAFNMLWSVWLSEQKGADELIYRFVCKVFNNKQSIETNFADDDVLQMSQLSKKVYREAEHIMQFVRFQKAADDIFFAPINTIYNALPLVVGHFKDRFADQRWVIYDIQRKYGFYYDLHTAVEITLDSESNHILTGKLDESLMAEDEKMFQELWKGYFTSLCIKERINLKLQRQHMPQRFWKYLTEKQ